MIACAYSMLITTPHGFLWSVWLHVNTCTANCVGWECVDYPPFLQLFSIRSPFSPLLAEPYVRRNPDQTVTICYNFMQGFCRHEQCWYFHPPLHIAALYSIYPPTSPLLPQVRQCLEQSSVVAIASIWCIDVLQEAYPWCGVFLHLLSLCVCSYTRMCIYVVYKQHLSLHAHLFICCERKAVFSKHYTKCGGIFRDGIIICVSLSTSSQLFYHPALSDLFFVYTWPLSLRFDIAITMLLSRFPSRTHVCVYCAVCNWSIVQSHIHDNGTPLVSSVKTWVCSIKN